ncbi:MAG: hypothetical protein ABIU96_03975 [Rhodanobacter sp.]
MTEEERKASRRLARAKWLAANPDKRRVAVRKYRESNLEKQRAAIRKWRAGNPERVQQISRDYCAKHRELLRTRSATYAAAHRVQRRQKFSEWYWASPEIRRARKNHLRAMDLPKARERERESRGNMAANLGLPGMAKHIPEELLNAKRQQLKLKRLLKRKSA